jgi:hypothetical protein
LVITSCPIIGYSGDAHKPRGALVGPGGARLPAVVAVVSEHPRVWILTVPPVPPAVDALVGALKRRSYTVTYLETVNAVRLIVLERHQEK